jgi:Holliday junction resolvase RusA-like endonuclease
VISFRVDGQPIPQGSMKVINGHIIHSQGSALAAWRSAIGLTAKMAGCKPTGEAVSMTLVFIMKKPKTVTRIDPTVAPDLDKLVRGALDALTAIAYKDDSQVIEIRAMKVYGEQPGVEIIIAKK